GKPASTGKYVKVVPGTLTILEAFDGEVHAKSDTVLYDGDEHFLYGITEDPEVTEGFARFTPSGTRGITPQGTEYAVKAEEIFANGTEVGEYTTTAKYARVYTKPIGLMGAKFSETDKYVKVVPGTLNIIDVFDGEVHAKSDTVLYDGDEHFVYGITEDPEVTEGFAKFKSVSTGGPRPMATNYYVKAEDIYANGTEVGEYGTTAEYALVYSWSTGAIGGKPASTGKYVKVVPGTLTILEAFDGEVHAKSDIVPYDGDKHSVFGITEDPDVDYGFAQFTPSGNRGITPQTTLYYVRAEEVYATGTEVGEYPTVPEYARVYTKGSSQIGGTPSETDKYVKVIPGTLKITDVIGEVHAKSDIVPYNGEEQFVYGITEDPEVTEGFARFTPSGTRGITPQGTEYAVKAEDIYASGTEVGEYDTTVEYARVYTKPTGLMGAKFSETDNFVKVVPGTLKITGIIGEVHAKSDIVPYDGDEHFVYGITEDPEVTEGFARFTPSGTRGITPQGTEYAVKAEEIYANGTEIGEYDTTSEYARVYTRPEGLMGAKFSETDNFVKVVPGTLTISDLKATPAKITYDLNGGNYNGDTQNVIVDTYVGAVITIKEAPVREGYEFVEWSGSSHQPGDSYTVEGDHTFTAVWKALNTSSPNGGDSDTNDGGGAANGGNGKTGSNDSSATGTGDSMNLGITLALMILAVIAILGLIIWRRREA
ncbi:MAG: InlB B-repeat-containing protein, partial [Bacillota bacterium]